MPTTLCPHPLRARYSLTLVGVTAVTLILTLTGCSGQDSAAPAPTIQTIPMSDLPTSSPEDQAETEIRQQYAAFQRAFADADSLPETERERRLSAVASGPVLIFSQGEAAGRVATDTKLVGLPNSTVSSVEVNLADGTAQFFDCSDTSTVSTVNTKTGETKPPVPGKDSIAVKTIRDKDGVWKINEWKEDPRACAQ